MKYSDTWYDLYRQLIPTSAIVENKKTVKEFSKRNGVIQIYD